MPGYDDNFPWMSYYGKYNFFEQRMHEHSRVSAIIQINSSLYDIALVDGKVIRTFICDCYSFDVAEYIEVSQEIGEVNAVIINSYWCGYTLDVKRYCMNEQVGIYNIAGFMAALYTDSYWQYLTGEEKEKFEDNGWLY